MILVAQSFDQVTRVNVNWAGCRAKPVHRARFNPVILILIKQKVVMLFVILFFKILEDPPDDDPSPGCGRKIPARTFMFTVSALNASVYLFLYRRKALQKSDVGILVVIN